VKPINHISLISTLCIPYNIFSVESAKQNIIKALNTALRYPSDTQNTTVERIEKSKEYKDNFKFMYSRELFS